MPKIAVCEYGRDTQRITGRILERLSSLTTAHPLTFIRRERTEGEDQGLRRRAAGELAAIDAALAIIGADWIVTLRADAARSHPDLELLLNSRKPIVPVLIDGTAIPSADELPRALKPLTFFSAISISSDAAFDEDVVRLHRAIQSILASAQRSAAPASISPALRSPVPPSLQPLPIAALIRKRQQALTRANRASKVVLSSSEERQMPDARSPAPPPRYMPPPESSGLAAAKGSFLWPLVFGATAVLGAAGYMWRHELGLAAGGLLKLLGLASAPVPSSPKSAREILDASAFAPASGRAGDDVLVQILLHASADASAAASLAQEADPAAARRGIATLAIEVGQGQRIDVVLEAGAIPIDEASQSLIWRGEPRSCQFILTLPRDQAGRTSAIKARILVGSVPAGVLRFSLKVIAYAPTSALDLVGEVAHRYRQAFLSHSHEDRVKVLTYAQLLDAIGIKYFQDIASLRAMEQWEHRLHDAIDSCDLFLLFWTASAAHSEWVERETRYALERQSRSAEETPDIMPVFLDADAPQPPEWLKSRHFDSILRLAMRGAQAESEKRLS